MNLSTSRLPVTSLPDLHQCFRRLLLPLKGKPPSRLETQDRCRVLSYWLGDALEKQNFRGLSLVRVSDGRGAGGSLQRQLRRAACAVNFSAAKPQVLRNLPIKIYNNLKETL
jgi:hypothetical protein